VIEITGGDGSVEEGGTQQLDGTGYYSDGSTADITGDLTWESSDTGVATVDENGLVTGVGAGTAVITATLNGVTTTFTITVTPGPTTTPTATPTPTPEPEAVTVPWSMIGGIIGGVLAAALLLFFLLRRKKGVTPEQPV
jgi:uncharacterized protein YjdB